MTTKKRTNEEDRRAGLGALTLAFALVLMLALAPALCAAATGGDGAWLRIGAGGSELEVVAAPVVLEFRGSGSLAFSADRRHIELSGAPRIVVGGEAASSGRSVRGDERVEVRDPASDQGWEIRRVRDAGATLSGEGTRIRDDEPRSEARVDSRQATHFFLRLDEAGGSLFFYPEDDG